MRTITGPSETIEEELAAREASRKELEEGKSDLYSQLKEVRSRLKDEEEKLNTAQENIRTCTQAVEDGKNEIIEILNSRANTKGKAQRLMQ